MTTANYNKEITENSRKVILEMNLNERISYEIALLECLSDDEVCSTYNVDSRQDAKDGIIEYFTYIY